MRLPVLPPFRDLRRYVPLVVGAIVLTQLPALPLLFAARGLGPLTAAAYVAASLLAAALLVVGALAWGVRIERIVGLVRGYAEEGRLPVAGGDAEGCEERVKASLATLDRVVRGLESDAARDPLTGIFNRRTCAARLEGDLARARRSGVPFSIAIFDLDDLKRINDGDGHAAGDAALRHLAGVLQGVVREGDWVARWGGDEFLVGFWSADGPAALGAVERALERLAAVPASLGERAQALGASVGVAQAQPEDDASHLFSRADSALLQIKRTGRGRVVLA